MDEVTYLDRLRLDVIDLPPGVDVFPDERFVAHLREIRKYDGIEPLIAQIGQDVAGTRALLGG